METPDKAQDCNGANSNKVPLVIDLDGTLTPTDTLAELIIKLLKMSPANIFHLLLSLLGGRAALKKLVVSKVDFRAENLPYREALLCYIRSEKEKGRSIALATASHRAIAEKVAMELGVFDKVIATDGSSNLKGVRKLDAIKETVGSSFVYAGDSTADIPVWESAKAAVLVDVSPSVVRALPVDLTIEKEFKRQRTKLSCWIRAIRIHQWLKNTLVFVPLLTAFSFLETEKLATSFIAFLSFSFAASATYIVNDFLDLDSDRAHPRKRHRPFACGDLSIIEGTGVAGVLLAAALIMSILISQHYFFMLVLYIVLTSSYSWIFKQYVLIDVIVLSLLYTIRILAGSVAIETYASPWLLTFSVFLFFGLALVKRCAELVSLSERGETGTRGRDYQVNDLVVLWPLGIAAALSAVVVFGLYISTPETEARYKSPFLLWLCAIGFVYWLSRLWIKAGRGEMHDDPIVYVARDRGSQVTILVMLIVTLGAYYIDFGVLY
jgi:4-hydroxybenzoate polyprenyltransferase/phosphoserine phosphatase